MSLDKLARGAFIAAALAAAAPDLGCNDARNTVSGEQSFPECGDGMKSESNGRYISYPPGSSEENVDCVRDRLAGRDCHAARDERRVRIEAIKSLFSCKDSQVVPIVPLSLIAGLDDFSSVASETKGDCGEATAESITRIRRVLNRLTCNKDGKLHEELEYGQAEGGRVYNPCAGGRC